MYYFALRNLIFQLRHYSICLKPLNLANHGCINFLYCLPRFAISVLDPIPVPSNYNVGTWYGMRRQDVPSVGTIQDCIPVLHRHSKPCPLQIRQLSMVIQIKQKTQYIQLFIDIKILIYLQCIMNHFKNIISFKKDFEQTFMGMKND